MTANTQLIAYCGLYCGECSKFKSGKCQGCAKNEKAKWCKIRACCKSNELKSCADCKQMGHENCKDFNNFMSKIFAFIFGSNRAKNISYIQENGYENFAQIMTKQQKMTFKRNEQN